MHIQGGNIFSLAPFHGSINIVLFVGIFTLEVFVSHFLTEKFVKRKSEAGVAKYL
jgi:hypothetical protein